jgi:hypothetical protein
MGRSDKLFIRITVPFFILFLTIQVGRANSKNEFTGTVKNIQLIVDQSPSGGLKLTGDSYLILTEHPEKKFIVKNVDAEKWGVLVSQKEPAPAQPAGVPGSSIQGIGWKVKLVVEEIIMEKDHYKVISFQKINDSSGEPSPEKTKPEKITEIRHFNHINCESVQEIWKNQLFSLVSNYAFVVDVFNQSPLKATIPSNLVSFGQGPMPERNSNVATVVTQSIPTDCDANHYLEGGFFFNNIFNAVYRVVPPRPIIYAPIRLVEAILNLLFSSITSAYQDLFYLIVDNSLNEDIYFYLDQDKKRKIPSRKQVKLIFKKGMRDINVSRASNGTLVESFKVDCNIEKNKENAHYIYNIGGTNVYKIHHVSYLKK